MENRKIFGLGKHKKGGPSTGYNGPPGVVYESQPEEAAVNIHLFHYRNTPFVQSKCLLVVVVPMVVVALLEQMIINFYCCPLNIY